MHWQEFEDPEKEKKHLEDDLNNNPKDPNIYYKLGTVFESMRDLDTAKGYCDKAIELDPKNITYYAFRSYVNSQLEESEDAIDDLVTIIELGGDESDYYVDVAQSEQRGMDREYAWLTVYQLRNEGKNSVADKLEEWLLKPLP